MPYTLFSRPGPLEMRYMTDFCLTYRYYMDSNKLLDELIALYRSLGERDADKSARMNVINFMQHWIKYHYQHDFEGNPELESRTRHFITSHITTFEGDRVASILIDGMEKRVRIFLFRPHGRSSSIHIPLSLAIP